MFVRQAFLNASLRSIGGKRQQLSAVRMLASRLRLSNKTFIRQQSSVSRHNSTAAALVDDYEDDLPLVDPTIGHAAAVKARASKETSHEEAWMVNLGRGNDNEWLTGPRPVEWFTGLEPTKCPGK
jgi:hypothetical protein